MIVDDQDLEILLGHEVFLLKNKLSFSNLFQTCPTKRNQGDNGCSVDALSFKKVAGTFRENHRSALLTCLWGLALGAVANDPQNFVY